MVGESGIKLSGGQRQRIAIARSIIRQPAILILDEATSSIDVQGEKIVQAALDRVSENRTTIMIAHRLSTIRKADHIIVLRDGSKVEEGTHEDLLSLADGLYSGLVRAQKLENEATSQTLSDDDITNDLTEVPSHKMSTTERVKSIHSSNAAVDDLEKAEEENLDGSYQKKGFFRTVGFLLVEQWVRWPFYSLVLTSAMGAGGEFEEPFHQTNCRS